MCKWLLNKNKHNWQKMSLRSLENLAKNVLWNNYSHDYTFLTILNNFIGFSIIQASLFQGRR